MESEKKVVLRNRRSGTAETLCSYCGNACNSGCSWSDSLEPVDGWEAVQNKNGYFVVDCPKFYIDDWRKRVNPDDLDTDGCLNLMEAFLTTLRNDYIEMPRSRRVIENFIRNPNVSALFFFAEPEEIIQRMRKGMRHGP